MKTTLDLPDHLITEVKIRAAKEKRKMKDVIAEALEKGLRRQDQNKQSTAELLAEYREKGGLEPAKAEKWISEMKHDRKNCRSEGE